MNSLGSLVKEGREEVNWITELVDCLAFLVNRFALAQVNLVIGDKLRQFFLAHERSPA
jgi:hypothetical protein